MAITRGHQIAYDDLRKWEAQNKHQFSRVSGGLKQQLKAQNCHKYQKDNCHSILQYIFWS